MGRENEGVKPLKPETVIAAIKERAKRRHEQAQELATQYPETIILRKDQPDNEARPWVGAIIHPSSRASGRWQISTFDLDGFAYDYSEASYEQAIYQCLTEGFRDVDMGLLDQYGETPRFMAGVLWSMLPDDKKWVMKPSEMIAQ